MRDDRGAAEVLSLARAADEERDEQIRNRAEEMTRRFTKGLVIGMLVGGGFMMIVSVVAFVLTLSLR